MKYLLLAVFIFSTGCAKPEGSSDGAVDDAFPGFRNHQPDSLFEDTACPVLSQHSGNWVLFTVSEGVFYFAPNAVTTWNGVAYVQASAQQLLLTHCVVQVNANGTYSVY